MGNFCQHDLFYSWLFDGSISMSPFVNSCTRAIPGFWRLNASQRLVTDHLVGIAILLNIYAFGGLNVRVKELFSRSSKTLGLSCRFFIHPLSFSSANSSGCGSHVSEQRGINCLLSYSG
jgi:hypothetical protein